jgi:hypothetical protein
MPIYSNQLTFKEPQPDEVALSPELLAVIRDHHKKSREHLFHLCVIAYGLRKHNLIKKRTGSGGNTQQRVYKEEFKSWYEQNNLREVYGVLSNFTLYAMAGRLLCFVRWKVGDQYIDRLPSSMTALYAMSQILWDQGDSTDDKRRALFSDALIKPIDDGTKFNTFIHPEVTRKEIEAWHAKQTDKREKPVKPDVDSGNHDPRKVVLATIKVHENLFSFTKEGRKFRTLDLTDVEQLLKKLEELVSQLDGGKDRFAIDSNLSAVREQYESAKQPDFGSEILAADQERKAKNKKD